MHILKSVILTDLEMEVMMIVTKYAEEPTERDKYHGDYIINFYNIYKYLYIYSLTIYYIYIFYLYIKCLKKSNYIILNSIK